MLDPVYIREHPDLVRERLRSRGVDYDTAIEDFATLEIVRRRLLPELEGLKRQQNTSGDEIARARRQGLDATPVYEANRARAQQIKQIGIQLDSVEHQREQALLALPNLPHASVPVGRSAADNQEVRRHGEPRQFEFDPQPHWDLGAALGILDFERAAKLAGARFAVYRGAGARLERALATFMLDLHTGGHGYTELIPPYLTNDASLLASGQLPKFAGDLFHLDGSPYWLIPTAEVPLVSMHRGEILDEDVLPLRYTALTPCFRSEAGSYGRDVRGLIRLHQFHKVEMVQITTAEASAAALEEITRHAAAVLERLELPYRVVTLSRGDMSFNSAKTHDLEVWLPSQRAYREISSCSNCRDFQARRGDIRYRPAGGGKPKLAHTLNGSGLAVGRTLVAVLETYQQADGSVVGPEPLRPYMGGLERIAAR
jgi:seryl-tRNA synthetase